MATGTSDPYWGAIQQLGKQFFTPPATTDPARAPQDYQSPPAPDGFNLGTAKQPSSGLLGTPAASGGNQPFGTIAGTFAAGNPAAGTVARAATGGGPYGYGGATVDNAGFHTQGGGLIPRTYGGANVFTRVTTRRGTAVDLPSMYDPARARFGGDVLRTGSGVESVMGRVVRRLSDAEDAGQQITPDLIQNEIRRSIGEALREVPGSTANDFGFVQAAQLMGTPAAGGQAPGGAPGGGTPAAGGQGGGTPQGGSNVALGGYDPTGGATGGGAPGSGAYTPPANVAPGYITDPVVAQQVAASPDIAYAMLRGLQGKTGVDRSIFGNARQRLYGQAIQALAQLGSNIDPASINAILGQVSGALGGQGSLGGLLHGAAQSAMGRDLSGMSDPERLAVLRALGGAATFDMSPLWAGSIDTPLQDLEMQTIQGANRNDTTGALTPQAIQASPFWKAIQQLAGTR